MDISNEIFKKEFLNFEEYDNNNLNSSEFGLIPKKWFYVSLDKISDVTIGKTPPRKEPQWFSETNGIKWISIKDLGKSEVYVFETSEYLTEEAIYKFNVKLIPKDTVILSFKLTVGRLGITTEKMVTNEAIAHFKLNNDLITTEYLYLYLKNFNYESLGSTSSIAKAINSKIVKKIPILIPSKKKLNSVSLTRRTEVERHPRTFYSRVFRQRGNWKLEQYQTVLGRKDRGFLTSTIRPARLGIRTVSNSIEQSLNDSTGTVQPTLLSTSVSFNPEFLSNERCS